MEIDQGLDEILDQITKIKGLAKDANREIDRQGYLVDNVDKGMDRANTKIKKTDQRLQKKFF